MIIFTFLWSLLFIIPGIIAALSYSQVFYILAEDTEKKHDAMSALNESKKIMDGHKLDYFVLGIMLSFIGILVTIFTLGIGMLWFLPYSQVVLANFYLNINGKQYQNELNEFLSDDETLILDKF